MSLILPLKKLILIEMFIFIFENLEDLEQAVFFIYIYIKFVMRKIRIFSEETVIIFLGKKNHSAEKQLPIGERKLV